MESTDCRHTPSPGAPSAVEGRWRLVDAYMGGVRVPEADLARLSLTIEDGTFTIGDIEGVIAVHDEPHCSELDMLPTRGPDHGQFVPAIYKRGGGALLVCYDLTGIDRPSTFDAPPGTRRFVALYRLIQQ